MTRYIFSHGRARLSDAEAYIRPACQDVGTDCDAGQATRLLHVLIRRYRWFLYPATRDGIVDEHDCIQGLRAEIAASLNGDIPPVIEQLQRHLAYRERLLESARAYCDEESDNMPRQGRNSV